jgi:hypothetical protein
VACMLVCLLSFVRFAGAHTYTISVVMDTDLALDDMRAMIMLLNSGTADIPLIVTSDGASSPEVGCRNAAMLLKYFNQERTVVAKGKESEKPAPPWRSWSEDVHWSDAADLSKQYRECKPAGAAIVSISEETSSSSAAFSYNDRKITLKIKDHIVAQIKAGIEAALKEHGGLNPDYFAHIRTLAIGYWRDLDRRHIFDEHTGAVGDKGP